MVEDLDILKLKFGVHSNRVSESNEKVTGSESFCRRLYLERREVDVVRQLPESLLVLTLRKAGPNQTSETEAWHGAILGGELIGIELGDRRIVRFAPAMHRACQSLGFRV